MKILANDYKANLPNSTKVATGGPARFSTGLSQALEKDGHTYVGVIIENTKTKNPIISRPVFKKAGSSLYFRNFSYPGKAYQSVTRAKKMIDPRKKLRKVIDGYQRLLQSEKPDLVFINGFSLQVWPLLVAAHELSIPIVLVHAGIWHKEIDIYKHFYSAPARKIMKGMEKDIPKLVTKEIFLNDFSYQVFHQTVTPVDPTKKMIIPLPTFIPKTKANRKIKNDEIKIGVVGRWDRIKNHKAVLELAKLIEKKDLPWQIHSVTKIPDTNFQKRSKDNYRRLIKIHAPMNNNEILKFFKITNIAIHPSHFDVSPTVVLEALSQGIGTIISKNVGWVNLYKKTGNTKWIGDFSKPETIIKKIKVLSNQSLSQSFIKHVQQEHNPKGVFAKYLHLFSSLSK